MAGKATKSTPAAKTSRPVTLKHLAATLAGEHQLTKRAGEALLGDLVGLITKHLKKGNESGLRVLVSCRSESGQLGWGAILQPEKRSKSNQVRKSRSERPRS
jgi:hypothetical protein